MREFTVEIKDINIPMGDGTVAYPADETARALPTEELNFLHAKVMVFGADGRLQEAGGNLYPNADGKLGSPQLAVHVPAGGFAVAFGKEADEALHECHAFAMEGAMLYNATMTVDREVYGRFDGETLTVSYEEAVKSNLFALKFLFIGNSCTYFNGIPLKFRALCRAAGLAADVTYCTFGAAFLREFADPNHRYHKALLDALQAKKYDFAVLQDANAATAEETEESVRSILPLLKENGARPYLYARYAPTVDPICHREETARLSEAYRRAGKIFGMPVAPVAEAFALCMEKYPGLDLYADDRSHLSALGSYLSACCMAESYLRIDVRGLSYDAYFGMDTAGKLQEIAHEICKSAQYPLGGASV